MMSIALAPGRAHGSDAEEDEEEAAAVTPLRSEMHPGQGLEDRAQSRRRRLLLVLDLNGLLLDSFDRGDDRPPALGAVVKMARKWIYERPGVAEFLRFCFSRFDVGVWSCAREENVHNYVAAVFPENLQEELLFVWGQKHCTDTGMRVPGNKDGKNVKPLFLKELAVLWKEFPQYGMTNTIMVDDTPYKSLKNPTFTAIFPKPYSAHDRDDGFLLREVVPWLEELCVSNDTVQSFVIRNPLGEPAISPSHPDWDLYSEVVYAKSFERPAKRHSGSSADPVQVPVRAEPLDYRVPSAPHRRTNPLPFPLPLGWPEVETFPSAQEPARFAPLIPPGFQPRPLVVPLMVQAQHNLPLPMLVQHQMQPASWLAQPEQQHLRLTREQERSRLWMAQVQEVAQMAQQYLQQVPQGVQQGWDQIGPMAFSRHSQQLPMVYETAQGDNVTLARIEGQSRRSRRDRRNRSHPYEHHR